MKILGIDPGFDRLGLAIVESNQNKPLVLWSACVRPEKGEAHDRLREVYRAIASAIAEFSPDIAAIESLYFSTNKKTAIKVAEARGAILAALGESGMKVYEYSPNQIKVAVAGNGNADKKAVARMVPQLATLPERARIDDEMDAIAIALTCLAMGVSR